MTQFRAQKQTVGIIEDDTVTQDRLTRAVASSKSLTPVFTVGTVREAIALLDKHKPTVLLVDLCLTDGDGTSVLAHMRNRHPGVLAMVISALGDETSVIRAIKSGAMGYLLKDDSEEVIEEAILQLLSGGSPISPPIARHLIGHFQPVAQDASSALNRHDKLSPRELDVLTFAAKGYSYQEVAELLGVTPNTVSSYTKRIYEKLEVNSRTEALFEATRLGLVAPPERG